MQKTSNIQRLKLNVQTPNDDFSRELSWFFCDPCSESTRYRKVFFRGPAMVDAPQGEPP